MKLYNSLTRSLEEFEIKDNTVRMYACGPTVYNRFHIGNSRCFVVFDMLRRYLEYRGVKVFFAQNFTDVDDKLIKKAAEEGTTVPELADKYIKEYFIDAEGLGIKKATYHPRATETMNEIIEMVGKLIEKGHAYVAENGDVYFSAESYKDYGKLSHLDSDNLEAGARIGVTDVKRHPFDFALWKARKEESEIAWESPWSMGRPGWHIECSAMIDKLFGSDIDIHGGGPDLIFPHHENEIAQTECATGKPLARFWLHNGYINVDNKKMSKSAGNFFMVRDAAAEFGYDAVRYFILSSHYRSPINYRADILAQAVAGVERLQSCEENLTFRLQSAKAIPANDAEKEGLKYLDEKKQDFINAMDEDFNTADALGCLFEMARKINSVLAAEEVSKEFCEKAYSVYFELLSLLGFEKKKSAENGNDEEIEKLVAERTEAKKAKNFARADEIRELLKNMGVVVEDTRQGAKWKRV